MEWLKTLDDSAHSETVVALGAIKSTDDQVDDTEVEDLSGRLFNSNSIFFFLNTLHQLLGIRILRNHDVRNAEISKDNGCDFKEVIHLTSDKRLVISDGVSVLGILHEENMGYVKFPSLVLTAKLC